MSDHWAPLADWALLYCDEPTDQQSFETARRLRLQSRSQETGRTLPDAEADSGLDVSSDDGDGEEEDVPTVIANPTPCRHAPPPEA